MYDLLIIEKLSVVEVYYIAAVLCDPEQDK